MNKNLKWYAICGVIGPILYAVTVIIGGLLRRGYSHIEQAVSELLVVGAPNKLLLDTMMIIYSILVIIFPFGLHKGINDGKGSKVGPVSLSLTGVLVLLATIFFPMDPIGEPVTFTGTMHKVMAMGLMPFLAIFGMLAIWHRTKSDTQWSGYDTYSLVTFIVAIIIGVMAGVLAGSPYTGLVERLIVGTILQWNLVMAIKLLRLSI